MKDFSIHYPALFTMKPVLRTSATMKVPAMPALFMLLNCLLILVWMNPAAVTTNPEYDLIIRNGKVLDGTGNPWFRADIAVKGDSIAAMGQLDDAGAHRVIDATDLFVAPGFIDVHSHAAGGLTDKKLSEARPLLTQGITTVIINPDGGGATDLAAQREQLLEHGLGVNVAQFVPHGAIRRAVIGLDDVKPTPLELREMRNLVEKGMETGAVGLSTGLFYDPASYAETDEIIELARVAHKFNGIHQSHIRDESDYTIGVTAAVEELIEISRQSGIVGVVSHIKALGPNVWGVSGEIIKMIDEARDREGLQIFADQYPYEASATGLSAALVPRWATAGGRQEFLNRLEPEETREKIMQEMEENLARRGGADRIMMRNVSFDSSLEGKTLEELAEGRGETAIETALWLLREGSPGIVSFNMRSDDVENFMRQPWTMTSSDGGLVEKGEGVPHPRNYGAFPRKLQTYSREQGVIDRGFAIRSMTSLSATVHRIPDRGLLRPGMIADIVVFDEEQLTDKATFTDPHQLSEGMVYVLVNGKPAIDEGELTGLLNGRILNRAR
jgi:N-acyl-D-amino-acid deacylase